MPDYVTRKSAHRRVVGRPDGGDATSLIRTWVLDNLGQLALFGSILAVVVAIGVMLLYRPPSGSAAGSHSPSPLELIGVQLLPSLTPSPTTPPTPTLPPPPEIAILAGHWSAEDPQGVTTIHDTGALCDDGLREVTINKAVADKVVARLRSYGYQVDLLQEFDPRLKRDGPDYAPTVFLAIHSDSCVHGPDYPLATGYKIAHAEPSDNPDQDDRLVACLTKSYDQQVSRYRLQFNENTITRDMTEYHAFREIVQTTPAAIVELGFMYNDRAILLGHQDELARGLADGLRAFLTGNRCGLSPTPTPTPSE